MAFENPHQSKKTGNLPQSYCNFVIRMTLKAHVCVCTPIPPPSINTHIHSHTDVSNHYSLLFCQSSDLAFLPPADNCVRVDFFSSFFGKGSDKLHSGILKCQLKMKINNLGVEKGFTILLISHPPPDRLG